ncbi:hypothetical protein EDD17DRAFT_798120 [Pisolithus thermaeus]|nr:hypothetical protein EDD17DRAFT_798120 [Pisolithus thermaeus]
MLRLVSRAERRDAELSSLAALMAGGPGCRLTNFEVSIREDSFWLCERLLAPSIWGSKTFPLSMTPPSSTSDNSCIGNSTMTQSSASASRCRSASLSARSFSSSPTCSLSLRSRPSRFCSSLKCFSICRSSSNRSSSAFRFCSSSCHSFFSSAFRARSCSFVSLCLAAFSSFRFRSSSSCFALSFAFCFSCSSRACSTSFRLIFFLSTHADAVSRVVSIGEDEGIEVVDG